MNGRRQNDDVLRMTYRATKSAGSHRAPCIDTTGNFHVETDIYDVHDYEQDQNAFKANYAVSPTAASYGTRSTSAARTCARRYDGKPPVFVSEYGGIRWSTDDSAAGATATAPRPSRSSSSATAA